MGGASIWHWIVVGLIVVLLFGRGKISDMMGDVAKGIKAFKKGMSEEDAPEKTAVCQPILSARSIIRPRPPRPRPTRRRTTRSADRRSASRGCKCFNVNGRVGTASCLT